MTIDASAVEAILREVGEAVVLPRFGRLAEDEIRTKSSPSDVVTDIDVAAEAMLRERLFAIRPDAEFIGEEIAAADPSIVAAISGPGAFWIVDPLDGTRNFVRNIREFGTIVALVENGRTEAGWIYAIPAKACAVSLRGKGAKWNGASIVPNCRSVASPLQGLRSTGWLSERWRLRIERGLSDRVQSRQGNCAAYAYIALARGEVDFKISSRIHPWDHAAGALILSETGGSAKFIDDEAAYSPADSADRPLLAVSSGRDWAAIRSLLVD